jgi:hypothetical protein
VRERLCTGQRSIDDENFFRTALGQAPDHCSGSAPGANHDRGTGIRTPGGLLLQNVVHEPIRVVVRAPQRPIRPDDDAADGADAAATGSTSSTIAMARSL